ncbi:hypothetical protein Salat_0810200 [Sesamum alatum]|uniref:Sororin C-terminal region domain-containing protein n=1 Tax=Sesamum alatum TaxID=300844 RepID=A0AAE1YU19_9LAMI|nr:hypothetical protein Salat_0810200 [Sesamum alatum]
MESRKRKPLSDISNTYNLIPTSALRELVASTSNPTSFSKSPILILKSNASSTNQKLCSDSSNRSDTSIGSSNVSALRNSRTVQFRTPPRLTSSISSPGDLGSKHEADNQRKTTQKSKIERGAKVVIVSPIPVEKRKDKGKVVTTAFSPSPAERMKDNQKVVVVSPIPVEKRKDKGKAIALPFSSSPPDRMKDNQNKICYPCNPRERKKQNDGANQSLFSGPVEVVKESGKGILNSYSRSYNKTEKGKAILVSSDCSKGKHEDIQKGILDHSSCSVEKTNDVKKGILKPSGSSILKTKEMGKEFVTPSSFLVERRKEKGNPLNSSSSSHEKTREKRKANLQLSKIVEITKHKGSAVAAAFDCQPPRRKTVKGKNDAGASSCPAIIRTKRTQNDLDEAGDSKSSKSWTDPHPKCRKKKCSRREISTEVPPDFIEQQRAYFKEVDEFELPEEEVSQDELD